MNTKRCTKCGEEKSFPDDFYKMKKSKSGHQAYCKKCTQASAKKWDEANRIHKNGVRRKRGMVNRQQESARTQRHRMLHPDRASCRTMTYEAIRTGKLFLSPCVECGITKDIHAHHEDYSKPFEVTPLCGTHHRQLHAERQRAVNQ
jgi:hypothetical protein